jgi:hypothetical protein
MVSVVGILCCHTSSRNVISIRFFLHKMERSNYPYIATELHGLIYRRQMFKYARKRFPFLRAIAPIAEEEEENRVLLGQYAANSGDFLQTFRDNLSVQSSRVKNLG